MLADVLDIDYQTTLDSTNHIASFCCSVPHTHFAVDCHAQYSL